ncbi:MAG: prevent-host-death protein [Candidatus Rokuibacteriota bacterium]|nr:MAG: prevent-host-death protein [Candidatus Rokubacteria bacterium]
MRWNIGEAKQRFSEVVRRAANEPQLICNRERVVAAVVNADAAANLESIRARASQRSLADAFQECRELLARERYTLKVPTRRNRRTTLPDTSPRVSR